MRLLILGGTRFVGRHLVDAAAAKGWDITLFNRGESDPHAFPELHAIRGDRDGGLDKLDGHTWDAAIDTCGYVPRLVRDACRALKDKVDHYSFISTISVYTDDAPPGADENAPVVKLKDPAVEEITAETYGGLKALCEEAAREELGDRAFIPRPGLIVGPWDRTDRFSYWVDRVARGGRALCPLPPDRPVQVIDARDLASWMIDMTERRAHGTLNATGPVHTFQQVLEACPGYAGMAPEWVDDGFLQKHEITPWTEMPLWLPGGEGDGLMQVDTTRARERGLQCRPLSETCADTLEWLRTLPENREWKAGLEADKESRLLKNLTPGS